MMRLTVYVSAMALLESTDETHGGGVIRGIVLDHC